MACRREFITSIEKATAVRYGTVFGSNNENSTADPSLPHPNDEDLSLGTPSLRMTSYCFHLLTHQSRSNAFTATGTINGDEIKLGVRSDTGWGPPTNITLKTFKVRSTAPEEEHGLAQIPEPD